MNCILFQRPWRGSGDNFPIEVVEPVVARAPDLPVAFVILNGAVQMSASRRESAPFRVGDADEHGGLVAEPDDLAGVGFQILNLPGSYFVDRRVRLMRWIDESKDGVDE